MKKLSVLLAVVILISGCERETYLQAVPCDDCSCEEKGCPETDLLTTQETFQVYDVPSSRTKYQKGDCNSYKRHCRKVCREVKVDK